MLLMGGNLHAESVKVTRIACKSQFEQDSPQGLCIADIPRDEAGMIKQPRHLPATNVHPSEDIL
jgi:hypothetical protein